MSKEDSNGENMVAEGAPDSERVEFAPVNPTELPDHEDVTEADDDED